MKLIEDAITATYTSSAPTQDRNVAHVQTLARVLFRARNSLEHVLVLAAHEHRAGHSGIGVCRQRLGRSPREDGVEKFTHLGETTGRLRTDDRTARRINR